MSVRRLLTYAYSRLYCVHLLENKQALVLKGSQAAEEAEAEELSRMTLCDAQAGQACTTINVQVSTLRSAG